MTRAPGSSHEVDVREPTKRLRCQPTFMLATSHGSERGGLRRAASATLMAGLVFAVPRPVEASNKVAVDVDLAYPDDLAGVERGWGVGARLGKHWDLWLLELTPELGGSYHAFAGAADVRVYRGLLGARLALGMILEPSIFAHAGIGRVGYSEAPWATGVAFDAGVGLDFTLIPKIDLGAHGALLRVDGSEFDEPLSWVALGAHVALEFDSDD